MDKTREPCVKKMSHLATQNLLYFIWYVREKDEYEIQESKNKTTKNEGVKCEGESE